MLGGTYPYRLPRPLTLNPLPLPPDLIPNPNPKQVGICWAALRGCYATEAEAIEAARHCPSLVRARLRARVRRGSGSSPNPSA